MIEELFSPGLRTDRSPMRRNESTYAFLDRSATDWAERQRQLVVEWFARVPESEAGDVRGRLTKGDDEQFEAVLWELFLHEAYRNSGYDVIVHPDLSGSAKRPDCVVEGHGTRFYLEAVRASTRPEAVAEAKLLGQVRETLSSLRTSGLTLQLQVLAAGNSAPATGDLRGRLQDWAERLDSDLVKGHWAARRYEAIPGLRWHKDDWVLRFTPLPLGVPVGSADQQLVRGFVSGVFGHDDAFRISAVLNKKSKKYGQLDGPLVIAVLSNTESGTEDGDFAEALYGAVIGPHTPGLMPPADKFERPGHWCAPRGWRRGHAPQVIAAQGLYLRTLGSARPRLWSTAEPAVEGPQQPAWLAPVELMESGPLVGPSEPPAVLFGLEDGWPGRADFAYH